MSDVKIEAKDLMQGNVVLINGSPSSLTALDIYDVDCERLIIEPIELTASILEKCGFVINGFKQHEMEIKGQSCVKRTLEFAGDYLYLREISNPKNRFDDDIITLWNKDLMKTFYLHSLQNLVFALTGSPLKIEL